MRISDRMFFNAITERMQRQDQGLFRLQEQISTGKKINRPSDDPVKQTIIVNSEKTLSEIDQFIRNIGQADASLSVSESVLSTIEDQLIRARELALQGANGTLNAGDRSNLAKELRQIYDQIVAVANTSKEGHYIFGGHQTGAAPFLNKGDTIGTAVALPVTITATVNDQLTLTLDGTTSTLTLPAGAYATGPALAAMLQTAINTDAGFQSASLGTTVRFDTDHLMIQSNAVGGTSNVTVTAGTAQAVLGLAAGTSRPAGTYLGDSGESQIAIDKNNTVIKNIPGDRLIKGAGGGIDILTVVGDLQIALESNSAAAIEAVLTPLNTASDQVSNERVTLGARLNRVTTTSALHEDFKTVAQRLKSEEEDLDITRAISELVLQENALEVSRSLAARIFNTSLMDFLR